MGSLENAFAYGDRVAGQHLEIVFSSAARQPFGVHLQNFIAFRTMAPHADPFRGCNPGVAASHGNSLEDIDATLAALRHFETARTIDLAEHGEAALRVTDERDVDLRVHQVILSVKLSHTRG